MNLLLMLILNALVTWMVEKAADAALNILIKKLRHKGNSNCLNRNEDDER